MMKAILLATAISFIGATAARAQAINLHVNKSGRQVITELEQIKPPPPVDGKVVVPGASATSIVMIARDWRCGRFFSDDQGRRWMLASGPVMTQRPENLSGWRLVTVDGQYSFFTVTGRLFVRQ
jgi:hypothetical protein